MQIWSVLTWLIRQISYQLALSLHKESCALAKRDELLSREHLNHSWLLFLLYLWISNAGCVSDINLECAQVFLLLGFANQNNPNGFSLIHMVTAYCICNFMWLLKLEHNTSKFGYCWRLSRLVCWFGSHQQKKRLVMRSQFLLLQLRIAQRITISISTSSSYRHQC
jgi:hypothetical protein